MMQVIHTRWLRSLHFAKILKRRVQPQGHRFSLCTRGHGSVVALVCAAQSCGASRRNRGVQLLQLWPLCGLFDAALWRFLSSALKLRAACLLRRFAAQMKAALVILCICTLLIKNNDYRCRPRVFQCHFLKHVFRGTLFCPRPSNYYSN